MGRRNKHLLYVDGFAFAGKYKTGGPHGNGGPGSPLIALSSFHQLNPKAQAICVFVEKNASISVELKSNISSWLEQRPTDEIRVFNGRFDKEIEPVVSWLEGFHENDVPPSFFFLDPYGLKGLSMDLIMRIMRLPRAEAFINLMWTRSGLSMAKALRTDQALAQMFEGLYGSSEWAQLATLPEARFKSEMRDLFIRRCCHATGADVSFARSFAVHRADDDSLVYWLVFLTNSLKGLEEMKRAMWAQDPCGNYRFGDNTGEPALFGLDHTITPRLQTFLRERYGGHGAVDIRALGDSVIRDTPYLRTHIRKHALKPMEAQGELVVVRPAGKSRGYPEGTQLTFK